jgi:transposase
MGTFDVENVLKERNACPTRRNKMQGRPKEAGRLRMPLHRWRPPAGADGHLNARYRSSWNSSGAPDLESTSRKHRVTAATLTEWRDRFLAGGEAGLKSRQVDVEDEEKRRLKSVVAKVSVDNELLREKIARLEDGRPLAFWKSKP